MSYTLLSVFRKLRFVSIFSPKNGRWLDCGAKNFETTSRALQEDTCYQSRIKKPSRPSVCFAVENPPHKRCFGLATSSALSFRTRGSLAFGRLQVRTLHCCFDDFFLSSVFPERHKMLVEHNGCPAVSQANRVIQGLNVGSIVSVRCTGSFKRMLPSV